MNDDILLPGEWAESLQFKSLRIILSRSLPRFTTDAVLLASFCRAKKSDAVVDMGSGTGIISLLVHGNTGAVITSLELNPELFDMFRRCIVLNGLTGLITPEHIDLREAYKKYNGAFEVAVCNPPYFSGEAGAVSENEARAMSRTLRECSLGDITLAASRLLKTGGRLYMCYPAARMVDLFVNLRNVGIEPKRMRFVRSRNEKQPYLILLEARKGAGASIMPENELVLYNADGEYTDEVKQIYRLQQPQSS